jgi:hypothetical protein
MATGIERLEQPLLELLFTYSAKPTPSDSWNCVGQQPILDAAVFLAEEMRRVAMEKDDENRRLKRPPINYRQFYVGAVGIGVLPSKSRKQRFEWFAFPAWNTKPHANAPKYCAEMRIIRSAREQSCICLGSLVVIGERQSDKRSGISREWGIDPCDACRDCMKRKKRLFRATTRIITAQPRSQLPHMETLPELMKAHGEKW